MLLRAKEDEAAHGEATTVSTNILVGACFSLHDDLVPNTRCTTYGHVILASEDT